MSWLLRKPSTMRPEPKALSTVCRHRHSVSVYVDNYEMAGTAGFDRSIRANRHSTCWPSKTEGTGLLADQPKVLFWIVRREQAVDRHVNEGGVANVAIAISIGEAVRLRELKPRQRILRAAAVDVGLGENTQRFLQSRPPPRALVACIRS